ncbi:MAG: peptidoglycan-binding protein [Proteobacteria bacterium]|nr:peptidoglycan-binding protein [Pseudomonadota bacterium]
MEKMKTLILMILMMALFPPLCDAGCITVTKAQTILKDLNYFPDAVDGEMGSSTNKSIRTFQADYDLKTTGELDNETCAALLAEEEKVIKENKRKKRELAIKKAQKKLKVLGYYPGPISGRRSDIPETDLIDFQKDHQLEQTGRLDSQTLKMLFSTKAHEKIVEEPTPLTDNGAKNETDTTDQMGKKATDSPLTLKPTWTWSVGGMQYQPKSLYDSTNYEALYETLNPEQAVTYEKESFVMNRLTLTLTHFQFNLATSRLVGGDNSADSLGFLWYFDIRDTPFLINLDYANIESDARYNNRTQTITTRSLNGEFLYRSKPGLAWGFSMSHDKYPTLVSCKNKDGALWAIRFDEDFQLSTLNLALRYDTIAAGKTGLFRSEHLFPYLTAGLYGGLSYGKVSGGVIDALSTDLSYSFSENIYRFNMRITPEVGLKYLLERPTFEMEMTLGYGMNAQWPMWPLPFVSDNDDEVEFYRRNLSHGLVLGLNIIF